MSEQLLFGAAYSKMDKGKGINIVDFRFELSSSDIYFHELTEIYGMAKDGLMLDPCKCDSPEPFLELTDQTLLDLLTLPHWLRYPKQKLLENLIQIRASIIKTKEAGYEYGITWV